MVTNISFSVAGYKRQYRTAKQGKKNFNRAVKKIVTNIAEKKWAMSPNVMSISPQGDDTFDLVPLFGTDATYPSAIEMSVGTTKADRVGNRIQVKKIQLNLFVKPQVNLATMADGATIRFMIIKDKQPNGAIPAIATMLNFSANYAVQTALMNPDWSKRFVLIKDFTHTMVVTGTNAGSVIACGPQLVGKIELKVNQIVQFNGTNGTTDEIIGANWYLLFSTTEATNQCCNVEGRWMVHYTDI